jgi:hypothetical protein
LGAILFFHAAQECPDNPAGKSKIGNFTIARPRFNFTPLNRPVRCFADVRFEAHYGLKSAIALGPKSADSVAKLPRCRATNFPREDETGDNRRSMQPQTRYRNRL